METCSFCGAVIEHGTGKTVVKKDGAQLHFCSSKCEKNMLKLKRNPIKVKWTRKYRKFRGKEVQEVLPELAEEESEEKEDKKSKKKEPKKEKKDNKKEEPKQEQKEEKKEEKKEPKKEKKESKKEEGKK